MPRGARSARRAAAGILLVAALASCGGDQGQPTSADDVERALAAHVRQMSDEELEVEVAGRVQGVSCSLFNGADYEGEPVFNCDVDQEHAVREFCAALIDGKLEIDNQDLPCPESLPQVPSEDEADSSG
jgi:hypothetical protein